MNEARILLAAPTPDYSAVTQRGFTKVGDEDEAAVRDEESNVRFVVRQKHGNAIVQHLIGCRVLVKE